MRGITPHLWFDTEAVTAARSYCDTFPDSEVTGIRTLSGTPSGDVDVVTFALFGQRFVAISAGPHFRFNPSVSFSVACGTPEEVERYWERLADGGEVLMELGAYPFNDRFGWVADRYGLSWQLSLAPGDLPDQRVTPMLMFVGDVCGRAQEAIDLYTSVFPESGTEHLLPHPADASPDREGDLQHGSFRLTGQRFAAMDSAHEHDFGFGEAISFLIECEDQAELDHYSEALSAVPEAEQCGWIKDRFGLSWQVSPVELDRMLAEGDHAQVARVTEAFLSMKRFDLRELERAYTG